MKSKLFQKDIYKATSSKDGNTLVKRDANGNFIANTITANLQGNSSTATKLQTARKIYIAGACSGSASFDGSSDSTILTYCRQRFFTKDNDIINKFRTTFNVGYNSENGPFITVARNDTDELPYSFKYSSALTFGMSDTHAYLCVKHSGEDAIIGGGYQNGLKWYKHLAFLDSKVAKATTADTAGVANSANTATNIKNTGTVTLGTATEQNAITITAPAYSVDKPVKLLNFNWYQDTWSIGNVRSSSTGSNGLGIFNNSTEKIRISTYINTPLPINLSAPINNSLLTATYLNGNKGRAVINLTGVASTYKTIIAAKSTNGVFTLNAFNSEIILGYTTNSAINAGTNNLSKSLKLLTEVGESFFPGTVTAPTFKGNLSGNVTGNLSGNVTGNLTGNVTGTANKASKLEHDRTINGTVFNGTSNITIPLQEIMSIPESGDEGTYYCKVMQVVSSAKYQRISETYLVSSRFGAFILNVALSTEDSTKFQTSYCNITYTNLTHGPINRINNQDTPYAGIYNRIKAGIININDTSNRFELWITQPQWCESLKIYKLGNNSGISMTYSAYNHNKTMSAFTTALPIYELYAKKENASLIGTPTAPTPGITTNNTQIATTAFTQSLINNKLGSYATKANPALSGVPTTPTAAITTNNTQIASTAFVQSVISNRLTSYTNTTNMNTAIANKFNSMVQGKYTVSGTSGWSCFKFDSGFMIMTYTNNNFTIGFGSATCISGSLYKANATLTLPAYPVAFKSLIFSLPTISSVSNKEAVADIVYAGNASKTAFPACTIEAWNIAKQDISVGIRILLIGTWK